MDDQSQQASPKVQEMADFTEASDPFALFFRWIKEAEASEPNDTEAMAVATVDADGLPNVRMILLKGADTRGFVFYTNKEAPRGWSSLAPPRPRYFSIGRASVAKSASGGRSSPRARQRQTPISPRGIGKAALGLAPPPSRGRSKAAPCSKRRWRASPKPSDRVTCLARLIGAATGSFRSRSNSGGAGPSVCMTASCSAGPHWATPGPRPDFIREEYHKPAIP